MFLTKLSSKLMPLGSPCKVAVQKNLNLKYIPIAAESTAVQAQDTHLQVKPPFHYQKDVTMENLAEIMKLLRRNPSYGNNFYNSETIFRAITTIMDRPWWTCRDDDGNLVGYSCISRDLGNRFVALNTLYAAPEARGHGIGRKLFVKGFEAMYDGEPIPNYQAWFSEAGAAVARSSFRMHTNEDKDVTIRYGHFKIGSHFPQNFSSERFDIVPFRMELFEKFIAWDTARVYGVPRSPYWRVILSSPTVRSYLAIEKTTAEIVGFGAVQPSFTNGSMIIGPLYAENCFVALNILTNLIKQCESDDKIIVTYYKKNRFMEDVFDSLGVDHLMDCSLLSTIPDTFPAELTRQMFLSPSNSLCGQ